MIELGRFLSGVSTFLGIWMLVMLLYQIFITFWGFTRKTKTYQDHDPESRFLVLVPAHNEEQVIGDIIENLQRMDYPRELYDFYIIADNCTDGTASVARSLGANVIETRKENPDDPTGKPIALKKALERIGDYHRKYDLMMIFDADNLMDTNMFREVNSQYLDQGKPDFIQCYLGCKNKQGIVAWSYYIGYTMTNRFFQLAKNRLGLNCAIGGTGFAMSTRYLKERGGWTTVSLTEDLEIQIEATLEGRRILWNHNTRVYDEKPTRMRASIRQKIRWGQGHWYVCFRNLIPSFRSLLQGRIGIGEFLSVFTYLFSLSSYVATAIQLIITMVLFIPDFHARPVLFGIDMPSALVAFVLFAYSYLGLFYLADWMDNRIRFSFRSMPMMVGSFFANLIISLFNQIVGLIRCRHQQQWVKTEHSVTRESLDLNIPSLEQARLKASVSESQRIRQRA